MRDIKYIKDIKYIEDIYHKIRNEECDETYLKWALNHVDNKVIYCNQILSEDFINNYLLNPEYFTCEEDYYLTYQKIKSIQTRIKNKKL